MVETFRARSSFVYAGAAWFLIAGMAWAEIINRSPRQALGVILLAGNLAVATYLLFVHPRVRILDHGIEIRNPMSDHTVGWQAVESIDSQYTMYIETHGRRIHAWAAPAPGRYHTRTLHPEETRHLRVGVGALIPAGDSPRAHSGVAAHMARVRKRAHDGALTVASTHEFHRARAAALCLVPAFALLLTR